MNIKAVLFDVIGTIVVEKDSSLINQSMVAAFKENNLHIDAALIRQHRGKDKTEMIKSILFKFHYQHNLAEPILNSFIKNVENRLNNFSENSGFRELLEYLKLKEIKIGIGTGLPKSIFLKLFDYFKWEKIGFDYIMTMEEIGKSRPDPAMIIDMIKKLKIANTAFLKVGDTIADIQEGKNAGVITAVILSGTQGENELLKAKPDFVIRALLQIKDILLP